MLQISNTHRHLLWAVPVSFLHFHIIRANPLRPLGFAFHAPNVSGEIHKIAPAIKLQNRLCNMTSLLQN